MCSVQSVMYEGHLTAFYKLQEIRESANGVSQDTVDRQFQCILSLAVPRGGGKCVCVWRGLSSVHVFCAGRRCSLVRTMAPSYLLLVSVALLATAPAASAQDKKIREYGSGHYRSVRCSNTHRQVWACGLYSANIVQDKNVAFSFGVFMSTYCKQNSITRQTPPTHVRKYGHEILEVPTVVKLSMSV